MTQNTAQAEQFTGLILLTGTDKPGIAASLFQTLAPFAVHVIDIEQVIINNRLILTVLIGANPAHQSAIEEDLNSCALTLDVDIATLFGKAALALTPHNLLEVHVIAPKLHPQAVALVAQAITDSGANIVRVIRTSDEPVSMCFTISDVDKTAIEAALAGVSFEDATSVTVKAL
jgi:phosphoserine phosphatase